MRHWFVLLALAAVLSSCSSFRLTGAWKIVAVETLNANAEAQLDYLGSFNRGLVVEFQDDEVRVHATVADIVFAYRADADKVWLTPKSTEVAGLEIRKRGAEDVEVGVPYRYDGTQLVLGSEALGAEITLERLPAEEQQKFDEKAKAREERRAQ